MDVGAGSDMEVKVEIVVVIAGVFAKGPKGVQAFELEVAVGPRAVEADGPGTVQAESIKRIIKNIWGERRGIFIFSSTPVPGEVGKEKPAKKRW